MTKRGRSWWLVLGGLTSVLVACKPSPSAAPPASSPAPPAVPTQAQPAPTKAPTAVKDHLPCSDAATCHADCSAGLADGCLREAMVYEIGIDVPVDSPRAVKLYRGLCDGGDKDACADLGWFLTDPGPQHDAPAGLALLTKTCDRGGARACELAALQANKANDDRDTPEGLELEARAAKLYLQDCEAGVYGACGEVKVKGPDAKAALALLESRCKQGVAAACGNLGSLHVFGMTDDSGASLVAQNGAKADELLEGACTRVARGCRFLAESYELQNDPRAEKIRAIACDAWDATSCWKLGKNERACDLGHASACTAIGRKVRL